MPDAIQILIADLQREKRARDPIAEPIIVPNLDMQNALQEIENAVGPLGAGGPVGTVLTGQGLGNAPRYAPAVTSFDGRTGAVTLIAGDLTGATPAPLTGVTDGSNAASGIIGEVFSTMISQGNFIQAGSGYYNLYEIGPIPPGDWDVFGNVGISGAATTVTGFTARYNDGNNPVQSPNISVSVPGAGTLSSICCAMPVMRLSLSAPFPTLYLQAAITGSGSVNSAYGAIYCRRAR